MANLLPKPRNIVYKKYDKEIDIYKFYIKTSIEGSLFAFGITGALLSYLLTSPQTSSRPIMTGTLLLPLILNVGFLILFHASIRESEKIKKQHVETCNKLGIDPFEMEPLVALCKILSFMYGAITVGLAILIVIYAVGLGRLVGLERPPASPPAAAR